MKRREAYGKAETIMKTDNRKLFRMLDADANVTWQGRAYDAEHAEERCFWDETPGSFERFTLQRWGRKKCTKSISVDGWITIYRNANLSRSR